MRVVADTNTVVSGLLWKGSPRHVLDAARAGKIDLFTTAVLLVEVEDVLSREKLVNRIRRVGRTPRDLTAGYAALARVVEPAEISPVILDDIDDDSVLACAVAARADHIVSGDRHLLRLAAYQGILTVTASQLLAQISK